MTMQHLPEGLAMIFKARIQRFRDRLSRGLVLDHPVWSWLVVAEAVLRAASYWFRPPQIITPTTSRIEGVLSYPVWTAVLLTVSTLIVVGGLARRVRFLAWIGHTAGVLSAATLASSIGFAALLDGEPWSGFFPLVVVLTVHAARANYLGQTARRVLRDFAQRLARHWGVARG